MSPDRAEDHDWVGEGAAAIHLVHRRNVREEGNRMTQSLCRVATYAYSPENQPTLPAKKLCGNCRNRIARIRLSGGHTDRSTSSNAGVVAEGLEPETGIGYGSQNQAEHEQPGALAPQHHP